MTEVSDSFRSRVPSTHLKQLSNHIISGSQLAVQETIGQGYELTSINTETLYDCFTGEFGIVYRAVMTSDEGVQQPVAVKTLKGIHYTH